MVKSRLFKIAMFWFITWAVANSITIIVEIYLLCTGKWKEAFKYFYDVFCLYGMKAIIKNEFQYEIESFPYSCDDIAKSIFNFIIYQVITIGLPLWLWWRKQTPARAYPLAVAAMFGSPLFFKYTLCINGAALAGCILVMIAFYTLLIIAGMALNDYWPQLDRSRSLFWQRPWK